MFLNPFSRDSDAFGAGLINPAINQLLIKSIPVGKGFAGYSDYLSRAGQAKKREGIVRPGKIAFKEVAS